MTRQQKNRIRGLFLLTVFSLNTLVGFACSLGVNMGYNKTHHRHDASHSSKKPHDQKDQHHHEHSSGSTQDEKSTDNQSSKDDCCTNEVADFIKLDKSVASGTILQPPVFLIAFVSQFILPTDPDVSLIDTSIYGSLRRSWHSTDDTDLRIVIQSFQI